MKKDSNIIVKKYKIKFKWILIIFIVCILLSIFYYSRAKKLIYKNIYNNIEEINGHSVAQLNQSIKNQMQFVNTMADSIDKGYVKTEEEVFHNFAESLSDYNFTRLAIVDKNGNGITSDGFVIKNYSNVEEFFNHEGVYLSENRPSLVSNNQVNIYSKTCYLNGKERILCAIINTQDYESILLKRLFNGKAGIYLINNNGTVLIDSFGNITENNINLYKYIKDRYNLNEKELNKIINMAKNIKKKTNGTLDIKVNNHTYFLDYQKIDINDWYVISVAPDDTIAKELIQFLAIFMVVNWSLNIIVVVISLYITISNKNKNRKLYNIAYIDSVTSIGNLPYFREKGQAILSNKSTNKYIVSLDINKFKAYNNIYGYEFCNKMLKSIGEILVNETPKNSIVCRLYSDVFAMIFEYDKNIKTLLKKIEKDTSDIVIDGTNINLNISMGVYKIKKTDEDINKILNKVYMARCKIKGQYEEGYYIYDEELEKQLNEEQNIESTMKNALQNNEFKVYYQPKFYTKDKKLAGAEALIRWYKDGIIIPPNNFIPLFEKNKFIIKLDMYIFEQVCKDMAYWQQKYNFVPKVSINVSKEHFSNPNFINEYIKIVNKYNIDRSKIDLEITESATVDKSIDIVEIINEIKKQGFTISIDDFGTGYSSLGMLQNMPIDIIKIDKVFVDKIDFNSDKNMINNIILICKQLEVQSIVEGVETEEQFEFVKNIGGDIIQGYYFSKPITKEEFESYFK